MAIEASFLLLNRCAAQREYRALTHSFQSSFSHTTSVYSHNNPMRQGGNDRMSCGVKATKESRAPRFLVWERVLVRVITRERDNKQGEEEVVSSALNVLCLK